MLALTRASWVSTFRTVYSPEDEQIILFETLRSKQLFSEPTLALKNLHMVVPASLLFMYSFVLVQSSFISTVSKAKGYINKKKIITKRTLQKKCDTAEGSIEEAKHKKVLELGLIQ